MTVELIDKVEDSECDNVDVRVVLNGQETYVATFFTLKNIESIMRHFSNTGECLSGTYFWSSNMIITHILTQSNIEKVIADMLDTGEFFDVFNKQESSF